MSYPPRSSFSNQKSIFMIGILLVFVVASLPFACGVGAFGPETVYSNVTIQSKYVDVSGNQDSGVETNYMVTTDKGTFEVDNGLFLNIWNADELYGKLEVGKQYTLTTKGERWTNMFMQYYPFITAVESTGDNSEGS